MLSAKRLKIVEMINFQIKDDIDIKATTMNKNREFQFIDRFGYFEIHPDKTNHLVVN